MPRSKEDWNGIYQIQCTTYAGYQHFREQAAFFRDKARTRRTKKTKMRADYRARLCENLAYLLGKIYSCQIQKVLRKMLARQRRFGQAVEESDRSVKKFFDRYAQFMLQAMTHLPDDPVVRTWCRHCRGLGYWDYLRIPYKDLEHGVKRPYPSPEVALADLTILELGATGIPLENIRKELVKQKLPAPTTREGIRKRLKSFFVQATIGTIQKVPAGKAIIIRRPIGIRARKAIAIRRPSSLR